MSLHHIVRGDGYGRYGRDVVRHMPSRLSRRRGHIEWRTVAMVAVCAVVLVALLARP